MRNTNSPDITSAPAPDHGADRPINTRAEDILGRSAFATSIARGIAARKGRESYIIGLYGPWGSGKSSVKNMILEALRVEETTCPTIIEFNPWQFKDAEQLTQAFFVEIAAALEKRVGSQAEADASKQSAARWKQLGNAMSTGGDAVANIARVAGFFGVPFTEVARSVGEAIKTAGGQTSEAAATLEATQVRSLSDIKAELRDLMRGLERPVLVVLDDIDRLSAPEMALTFQLVKVNGDFPNLVYLLLFQRDIVEASLDKIAPKESGADYLEKIIQLGLNLPTTGTETLFGLMYPEFVRILGETDARRLTTPERSSVSDMLTGWVSGYFREALMPYFETVRDVRRFVNALEFQAGMLRKDGVLQVNPADLIGMEVLRVFEPAIYNSIAANKDLFIINHQRTYDNGVRAHARLDGILHYARHQERVTSIIYKHFPNLLKVVSGDEIAGESGPTDAHRANLNVLHPACFDRYFQLSLPDNEISEQELNQVTGLLPDQNAVAEKLLSIHERGLLQDLIQRWLFRSEILNTPERIKQAFMALAQATDEIPGALRGAPQWPEMFVGRYLTNTEGGKDPVDFALECVQESNSLYLPAVVLITIFEGLTEPNSSRWMLKQRSDATQLRDRVTDLLRTRLHAALESGTLATHPRRPLLLRFWAAVEGPRARAVIDWINTGLATPDALVSFLSGYVRPGKANKDALDADEVWELSYFPLRRYMLQRLNMLDRTTLSPEQLRIVEAVMEVLNIAEERGGSDEVEQRAEEASAEIKEDTSDVAGAGE